jgi:uncharacterized membrane protein
VIGQAGRVRWLLVLLFVSLAVNLFFAGMVTARHVFGPPPPPPPGRMISRFVDDLADELPAPDQTTLRRIFRAHQAEIEQRSAEIARSRDRVREAIVADPFERDALAAALDAANDKERELRKVLQGVLFEAASEMSPEARHKLATSRPLR